MKTFSRLSLFTLICFGLVLGFSTTDALAQKSSLTVLAQTGVHLPNSEVSATFSVANPNSATLEVTSGLVNITTVNGVAVGAGDRETTATGILEVKGTVAATAKPGDEIFIQASWTAKQLQARADYGAGIPPSDPTIIVVKKPDKSSLKVGDSFTQMINIKGVDSIEDTDLSAWQMSVVYNPAVLKVTAVDPGTFLPESAFGHTPADLPTANGEVTVSQTVLNNAAGEVGEGTLLILTFEVLEIADELLAMHDVLLLNSNDQKLVYTTMGEGPAIVIDSFAVEDVNRDRLVNVQDLVLVAQSIGNADSTRVDVNGDGFVNIIDLVMVAAKVSPAAPAPAAPLARSNGNINPRTIQEWIQLAQVEDDGSAIFDLGIANLEALIASRIPSDTRLLLNYPNPFNPETWIPYQLAEATDVRVMIHSVNGSLIRMLELGHQAAGTYKNKSQAAYWDGRNELGEQVASGLYFYTLTAGDFSATGKMLIRK